MHNEFFILATVYILPNSGGVRYPLSEYAW